MELNNPILCTAVGFLCGIISGFGIGGGSVLMVWMTAVAMLDQRTAQGINLLYFLPTSLSALVFHSKNKMVCWKAVWPAALFGCIAAGASAFFASNLDVNWLRKLFGVFLLIVGALELFKKKDQNRS